MDMIGPVSRTFISQRLRLTSGRMVHVTLKKNDALHAANSATVAMRTDAARAQVEREQQEAAQAQQRAAAEKARLEQLAAEERARNDAARAESEREQALVVDALARALDAIAKGDLTCQVAEPFAGRYEKLRDVIEVFDRVWYGFQTVDENTYKSYVERVEELREKKE